jgi:hypothetical protein
MSAPAMPAPALTALAAPEADVVSARATAVYVVQVRYAGSDWITITRLPRGAAIRAAARAYRDAVSPDGQSPYQVRLLETRHRPGRRD